MAVIVDFVVPDATPEQLYEVEALTTARGEAAGGPPYDGMMFLAVTAAPAGFRFVSGWRTEAHFRTVLETMLAPDLATVGLAVDQVTVAPAVSLAIPHG